jgi:D-alanyl-lipoteichoic acid acyltransferase DltB (MBOAT superfamily)
VAVPSYEFFAFAAVVALVINLSRSGGWRRGVLLVANLAFAATFSHDAAALVPFAALLVLGFACVKLLERRPGRALFVASMIVLCAAFFWLKRYAFVPPALFLQYAYVTAGTSYVFFRILHLVIDTYQRALPERIGALSYANYTLNFTALVSGPIQLYRDYRRTESEQPAALTEATAGAALERIVLGTFKVWVLAPLVYGCFERAAGAVAPDAAPPASAASAGLAIGLYPLFLYLNFSGYTDAVIGVARFLRLELPENFDRPFLAHGYLEFWSRWHMTLSNWLKTYVYSPLLLALMHRFPARRAEPYLGVFAYFVTFFLVGAWHGQTTLFLVFGVLQGLGVSLNKLYQIVLSRRLGRARYRALCAQPAYAALSRGATYGYYAFSSLWFWSSWPQLARGAAALGPLGAVAALALVVAAATVLLAALARLDAAVRGALETHRGVTRYRYARTAWAAALLVVTLSLTVVLSAPAPAIVYRAF